MPRLQGRGCSAGGPPEHQLPTGHTEQVPFDALKNVPGWHDTGIALVLPVGHLVPKSHSAQADAPELAWYVPSWQGMHWSLALRANVPGVHSRGVTEPMIQACPVGQGVHPSPR